MKFKVAVLNGPNLNMLGTRETNIYGSDTLADIENLTNNRLAVDFPTVDFELEWLQSNIEGELVGLIQKISQNDYSALVINPGGYAHTSVAILDALRLCKIPIAEVHITNTYRREPFRHQKLTAQAATFIMEGLGIHVYYTALRALWDLTNNTECIKKG